MPAIAGIVYEEALNKKASVENMLAILSHRGSGKPTIWSKDKISLGTYPTVAKLHFTHPHIVLFDGTLFNIPELQSLVKAPTESVEELISCLYDTYKEKFPLLLNGPFAVAIYHTKSQELLLFRDRLGQKPLYWGVNNNTLVFASELKAMLASGEIPQKPDLEALSFYFSFGFIPQEKSPIAEVNKLLPGHYLRFTREKKLTIRPYWSYNSYLKNKTDQKQEELDALISDAVQLRVNDQKPFACFLSSTKEQSNLFFS